jgi:hypothetical protein
LVPQASMGPASSLTSGIPSSARSKPIPVLKQRKVKTRRGRRKSQKHCINNYNVINHDENWLIFHSNCRGYNSKKDSIKHIVKQLSPNVITLNEVGLRGNKKCIIQGYDTFTRNRKYQNMGGIATGIRKDESQFCLKVEEGENDD